jgi:hypothetical protein
MTPHICTLSLNTPHEHDATSTLNSTVMVCNCYSNVDMKILVEYTALKSFLQ